MNIKDKRFRLELITPAKMPAIVLAIVLVCLLCFGGCTGKADNNQKDVWTFTDSCGREVELPQNIETVAPSGSYAQVMLLTVCPEKLIGLSSAFTREQKKYFPEEYAELPVLGQFYGGGSTFNYEEIINLQPDIIIDIGEAKTGIAGDMDDIQKTTGIPVIFVQADMKNMAAAYETLGKVLGVEEKSSQLSEYIKNTLSEAEQAVGKIPDGERKRVLYSQGEYGTEVSAEGSVHAEVLDYAGAENVAKLDSYADKGGTEVSMEQIIKWDPQVVILAPDSYYDGIKKDSSWAEIQAVKENQVFEAPIGPYNWMDRPPSVQRILAVKWLGNLLYPEFFSYDIKEETKKFYKLFYNYDISDTEIAEMLANARNS